MADAKTLAAEAKRCGRRKLYDMMDERIDALAALAEGLERERDDLKALEPTSRAGAVLGQMKSSLDAACADIERLTRERDEEREERGHLTDVLHGGGFVRCDLAACNCGSWHARFGYPERFREFTAALEEHGANLFAGKTALTVLKECLAELDALKAAQVAPLVDVEKVMALAENMVFAERGVHRGTHTPGRLIVAREALRAALASGGEGR